MKKFFAVLFVLSVVFNFGLGSTEATGLPEKKEKQKAVITPKEYAEMLGQQDAPDALQQKECFLKLPRTKQEKIINFFTNPNEIKKALSQEIPPNSKKVCENGVVIESKTTVTEKTIDGDKPAVSVVEKTIEKEKPSFSIISFLSPLFFNDAYAMKAAKPAKKKVKEFTAAHTMRISTDVSRIDFKVKIIYRVINDIVTEVIYKSAAADKHMVINPVTLLSLKSFITQGNNMAHGDAFWEVSLPVFKTAYFDFSPISTSKHHQVHGYKDGRVTYGWIS